MFTYDVRNRETSEQWLDSAGKPIYTFQFTYDAAGELTSASDPDSSYTYTYDLLGRQTSVITQGTPGVPEVALSYGYDRDGNTLTVSDTINGIADGTEGMTYDTLNRETADHANRQRCGQRAGQPEVRPGQRDKQHRPLRGCGRDARVASTSYMYNKDGLPTAQTDCQGHEDLASIAGPMMTTIG